MGNDRVFQEIETGVTQPDYLELRNNIHAQMKGVTTNNAFGWKQDATFEVGSDDVYVRLTSSKEKDV